MFAFCPAIILSILVSDDNAAFIWFDGIATDDNDAGIEISAFTSL